MFNVSTTRPESGRFVMFWVYNGHLWSETCKSINDVLYMYANDIDDWTLFHINLNSPNITNVTYIQLQQEDTNG